MDSRAWADPKCGKEWQMWCALRKNGQGVYQLFARKRTVGQALLLPLLIALGCLKGDGSEKVEKERVRIEMQFSTLSMAWPPAFPMRCA